MDFSWTPEQEQFRKELRDFLRREVPDRFKTRTLGDIENDEGRVFQREWKRKLNDKSWMAISWPKEYGGQARPPMEQLIYAWEMSYYHMMPDSPGLAVVGPTVLHFGTEEQKREWLPRVSRGEITFALGYTEPNAGSDLASLQTRAVRDGDE
ncbi:MAG: acyl-CoA dehydrogenase family protein [Chloroflexi bacterium]|nr:acyl-CoA dehydrogenase family protein [Chloroflexota bacterium]